MTSVIEFRRQQMALLRYYSPSDELGRPKCYGCGRSDCRLEMHEMINRGQTVGLEDARQHSFLWYLCCLLCSECHAEAPTRSMHERLWHVLYQLHGDGDEELGYQRLQTVWKDLVAQTHGSLDAAFATPNRSLHGCQKERAVGATRILEKIEY